ncbi:MAG: GTPase Era [Nitrosomonas sp.]
MSVMDNFRTGHIAIVGRPNVGKSTLLNQLLQQKISITSKKAQTTRFQINGILTESNAQYIFIDTPGFQTQFASRLNSAMNRVVRQSMHGVDVVLFVIEVMVFGERDIAAMRELPKDIPVILVMNKIDLVADKNLLLPFTQRMSSEFDFAAIVPVSASQKIQLTELLSAIYSYLPISQPLYNSDEITNRSQHFIAGEFIREKMFRLTGDELPYSTAVVIDQFKDQEKLIRIHATIFVGKSNQKAIIIGKDGEKLKQIAMKARQDMELLFGKKVFLQVWVKVKRDWVNNEAVLKSLGYES